MNLGRDSGGRELRVRFGPITQDEGRIIGWYTADQDGDLTRHELARTLGRFYVHSRAPRRHRTDTDWAAIAALYVEVWEQGCTRPHKPLAAILETTPEYSRKLVGRARQRGMLIGMSQGRAGGQLSRRAKELLSTE